MYSFGLTDTSLGLASLTLPVRWAGSLDLSAAHIRGVGRPRLRLWLGEKVHRKIKVHWEGVAK